LICFANLVNGASKELDIWYFQLPKQQTHHPPKPVTVSKFVKMLVFEIHIQIQIAQRTWNQLTPNGCKA